MPLVDRQLQFRGSSLRVQEEMRTASDAWDVIYEPAVGEDPRAAIYDAFLDWQLGQPSPTLPGYRCKGHSCDNGDSPIRYNVTVTYGIEDGTILPDVPETQPPTFEGEGQEYEENLEVDLDGVDIATTAGEPMEPGTVTRRMSDFAVVVTRNYPNIPGIIPYLAGFANYVNSDTFLGGVPGTVLIFGVPRLSYNYPKGSVPDYWRITWRFVYRDPWPSATSPPANSAWFDRVKNMGYQIKPGGGALEYAKDPSGALYTRPQYIAVNGQSIATTPNFLWFRKYPPRSFAPLGIFSP